MEIRTRSFLLALTAFFLAQPSFLKAADIETLLMPGKVVRGHAEIESECSKCHARFSKKTQTRLCLDCHDSIDADIKGSRGFHGRSATIKASDCRSCHSEHLGRDADIVLLNTAIFDHKNTDFQLTGNHSKTTCNRCHLPGEKYSKAPSACFDCHEKSEPHKGELGKLCNDCHTTQSWKIFDFDHDKTDFALHGAHNKTPCSSCHLNQRYKDTPKVCVNCHALDDVHNGANGKKCESCHGEEKWTESHFDHNRKTDFKLRGKHAVVSCTACHIDPVKDKKPDMDCFSCHKNDDSHHGRYGEDCKSCHSEKSWKRGRFDHQSNTDFPLRGRHEKLNCSACHQGHIKQENLSVDCFSCHRSDDVHKEQEGKQCQRCHQESGWDDNIVFDHDLTHFPLLGLHAIVPCEECHLSATFRDPSLDCISCHRSDDEHKASLGSGCHQCHNPNSWSAWIFDHSSQTDFELEGAHEALRCVDCHNSPTKKKVKQSSSCKACHMQDDTHQGRFGQNCSRCHTTGDFRDVQITR